MAQGPLSEADADYLTSLPDTPGENENAQASPLDGVHLNDTLTQADADFLRQTQKQVEAYRQQPPSDFLQRLQQRKTPAPDRDFMDALTQRQQAAMAQLEKRGQGGASPGRGRVLLPLFLPAR